MTNYAKPSVREQRFWDEYTDQVSKYLGQAPALDIAPNQDDDVTTTKGEQE